MLKIRRLQAGHVCFDMIFEYTSTDASSQGGKIAEPTSFTASAAMLAAGSDSGSEMGVAGLMESSLGSCIKGRLHVTTGGLVMQDKAPTGFQKLRIEHGKLHGTEGPAEITPHFLQASGF